MKSISTNNYPIHFGENAYSKLNIYLDENDISKIIVLTDSDTTKFCYDIFISKLNKYKNRNFTEISFSKGEENKNISTCQIIWNSLSETGVDRSSLMINLGGGVVTDLGGFVASTFMRGFDFVNVPTTLLAMVDASIGGKTGVDLNNIKNQIGVINNPSMIIIDPIFLETLPQIQMNSGFSEMIKHSLISSKRNWDKIKTDDITDFQIGYTFYNSILIKSEIVDKDPNEKNIRKVLNYGHTIGHAVESFCLNSKHHQTLTHGESIAIGMILEGYISTIKLGFNKDLNNSINKFFLNVFTKIKFTDIDINEIIKLLKYDKKNRNSEVNFVLLKDIGDVVIDQKIENKLIRESFLYYINELK